MSGKPQHPERQIASPRNTDANTGSSAGGQLGRRAVLGGGLAVAGMGPLAAFAPTAEAAARHGCHDGSLQKVSGHALYSLPQDHKWHTGGIFDTGQLQEWHYWTGFFTDDDTGEKVRDLLQHHEQPERSWRSLQVATRRQLLVR
jgi:hypothetical protein